MSRSSKLTMLEHLLAEITLLAPAGARVSVSETLHSAEPPEYAAAVHVDGVACVRPDPSATAMIGVVHFERAPEKLVARIGAQLAQGQCLWVACVEARAAASIEESAAKRGCAS